MLGVRHRVLCLVWYVVGFVYVLRLMYMLCVFVVGVFVCSMCAKSSRCVCVCVCWHVTVVFYIVGTAW